LRILEASSWLRKMLRALRIQTSADFRFYL